MTEYKFNNFPFNTMTWLSSNMIEATFNIGNPKQKDVILYNDKFGQHRFEITAYSYKHDLYYLYVKNINGNGPKDKKMKTIIELIKYMLGYRKVKIVAHNEYATYIWVKK